jgi:ParB-like chromosome segregation protein Spo0J
MGAKDVFSRAGNNFKVPLTSIVLAPNVRRTIVQESIAVLANSLMLEGQRQAIKGYLHEDGEHFVVTAGQRRYRAAMYAVENHGWETDYLIADLEPKIDGKNPSGPDLVFKQLTDGVTQEKLCVEDQALAIKDLIDNNGYTVTTIAERMKCSGQHIRDLLKFLESPEDIKDAVRKGVLTPTTAIKTARARKDTQEEVRERVSRGESVKGVEIDTKERPMTPDEIKNQIKIADGKSLVARTQKEKDENEHYKRAFRIVLRYAEPLK